MHAISTLSLISTTLLSSHRVLDLLLSKPFSSPIRSTEIREAVYLAYQPWAAREPDHVFERSWQVLTSNSTLNGSAGLFSALRAVAAEFLAPHHGVLHVKLEKFGAWQQSVASRICTLPVQAASHAWPPVGTYMIALDPPLWLRSPNSETWASVNLPVLTPYDPLVEDYLEREGLHETHLHLNGSTHAEQCWLRALHAPDAATRDFEEKWVTSDSDSSQKMRELARAINPELSPTVLRHQLHGARHLRAWLIAEATGVLSENTVLPSDFARLFLFECSSPDLSGTTQSGFDLPGSALGELRWLHLLLRRLECDPKPMVERMLHCYLILQNQYYRLLVQSEEQLGFDQFQKLTWTNLREPAEQDYEDRFQAIHGKQVNRSRIGYLEGRFAPKTTVQGNEGLLTMILTGYLRYLCRSHHRGEQISTVNPDLSTLLDRLDIETDAWSPLDRRHLRLGLLAHFIKQPWDSYGAKAGPYRYYELRCDLELRAHALVKTLENRPRLQVWLRGIDAAANELHAPPEVFASCYRICRHAGLTRRSYHAGEDFPHLLSGLRHMLDAMELLDLRDCDRIGHGTAMGISPQLWLSRMPNELVLCKGDWMLDLLAAWRLLRRLGADAQAYRVERDLSSFASQLFGKDVSCTALERAMHQRNLHLGYLQLAQDPNWSPWLTPLNELQHAEAVKVFEAVREFKQDIELLWIWQSDRELWQRSESMVTVRADYLDAETYVQLQQELMRTVSARGVLIETLPSSNVRISHYRNFAEHHAMRWMRVPGFLEEGDPSIMVTLGSDDPGIFAGDLNSEFYQLYAALRGHGLGDKEALAFLAPLNERGRQYRFHDLSIGS